MGIVFAYQGRIEEVEDNFFKSIELNPDDIIAYNKCGVTYRNIGKFEKALEVFNIAIELEPDDLEEHNLKLQEKYNRIAEGEVRYEELHTENADVILVGYGIVSRVLQSVIEEARSENLPVGLLRPITLWPFPTEQISKTADELRIFLTVEMSTGQMVEDVKLAVAGKAPVVFYGRTGGGIPTVDDVLDKIRQLTISHKTQV